MAELLGGVAAQLGALGERLGGGGAELVAIASTAWRYWPE